jgi:hypothetical protein
MNFRTLLLATSSLVLAVPAVAQDAPTPPWAVPAEAAPAPSATAPAPAADEGEDGGDIIVTGQKPRGSVVGDIPPENTLSSRDIRATGATSITELLAAIAPQTGSARGRGGGGGPVILLNGQRISGFQEIRDLPPEAIERVEILPEEVALKYGYSADQRVVNMVLRQRFRSTAVRVESERATEGGYVTGEGDISRLMVGKTGRTQFNLHAEGNSALGENQREIALQTIPTQPVALDPRDYRTLVGSQRIVRGGVVLNRSVLGDVSATVNGEASHSEGRSLFGIPTASVTNGGVTSLQGFPALGALARDRSTDAAHLGLTLNGQKQGWRWSATGNGDLSRSVTNSDRGADSTGSALPRDDSRSTRKSAGIDTTLNGPLANLPAGRANVTFKLAADTLHLDTLASRAGVSNSARLGRTHEASSASVDLPIAKRNGALGAIGSLTLNANAGVDHFSDFGTLTTLGSGANWSPAPRLSLITSYTREEGAPSLSNLGDPVLASPGTRVFDYTQGRTVLVTATTGGNPLLLADRRSVWKLGADWQPWEKTDLKFRADFVSSRLTNPVQTFPGPSAAIEAAFPGRFTRDALGNLTAVDFRPVNYASARSEVVRIGFDFTKPLKSAAPSQAMIEQFRRLREQGGARPDGARPEGGGRGGRGGFGGGGGGGGFGQRGRLTFSLTDTIALVDKAVIRQGIPELDFLSESAASGGSGGGRARHMVEAQAGYFNNGVGLRFSANYRSATRITGGPNGDLKFEPLATFDLRLFINPGDNLALLAKHPWLRGTSIRFEAKNLLNERQRVRDNFGMVPLGYQQDLLDPIGRTVGITLRKLFIPSRFFGRGGGAGRG